MLGSNTKIVNVCIVAASSMSIDEQQTLKRCAIYSRSSVEKNNRDLFDSVSAQFMACADFIGSHVGQGWRLVDTIYEDRGLSSSHRRRAGFRCLLNDIKLGLVDIVVVHRLGRLTRSLADFQQIIVEKNAHRVPLVSVAQQIDLSHHVGRLSTKLVVKRLMNLAGLSEELFTVHQMQLVMKLIDRVTVYADRLDIDFSIEGLMDLILELLAGRPDLVRMYRQLYSSARIHGL